VHPHELGLLLFSSAAKAVKKTVGGCWVESRGMMVWG
jgi:hypothetical protein